MCNTKNNIENIVTHRGVYSVWVQTYDNGTPRLVSLWIDPLMKAFEPHDALREAEITANPAPFSDDEPPSWKTLNEDAVVVHGHSVKNHQ